MAEIKTIQSIERAIDIINSISAAGAMRITELSRELQLHKATVSNIVRTLCLGGYLSHNEFDKSYTLGPQLCRISANACSNLRQMVSPHIRDLAHICGETVNLGIRNGRNATFIDVQKGVQLVSTASDVGTQLPIYASAFGRAIMAFLPEAEREELIKGIEYTRFTQYTICTEDRLREELARTVERGYSINFQEVEYGHVCIAAPILNNYNYPVASMSVSGVSMHFTERKIAFIVEALLQKTREISEQLGSNYWEQSAALPEYVH